MTTYNFGDVLLVPFPFTDQTTTKKRPTVVISSDRYNQSKLDILLIAVTSQVRTPLQFGEILITLPMRLLKLRVEVENTVTPSSTRAWLPGSQFSAINR